MPIQCAAACISAAASERGRGQERYANLRNALKRRRAPRGSSVPLGAVVKGEEMARPPMPLGAVVKGEEIARPPIR